MGELRNAYKILVREPEGKRPFERPRRRCDGNIRMDLKRYRVGRCGLDASGSGYRPVAKSYENGNETLDPIKAGKFID
jgi:hypothetical protein